jgi:hypothetical protein
LDIPAVTGVYNRDLLASRVCIALFNYHFAVVAVLNRQEVPLSAMDSLALLKYGWFSAVCPNLGDPFFDFHIKNRDQMLKDEAEGTAN